MQSFNRSLLPILVLVIVSATVSSQAPTCEQLLVKTDENINQSLFMFSGYIPKNKNDLEDYCANRNRNFLRVRDYGIKCLKNIPRQIFLGIYKNIRKVHKTFCSTEIGKNGEYNFQAVKV